MSSAWCSSSSMPLRWAAGFCEAMTQNGPGWKLRRTAPARATDGDREERPKRAFTPRADQFIDKPRGAGGPRKPGGTSGKSFGDKPAYGAKPAYGSKPAYGAKPGGRPAGGGFSKPGGSRPGGAGGKPGQG